MNSIKSKRTNKIFNPSHARSTIKSKTSEDTNDIKEKILDTGRLFVRNLSFKCTEENLVELFKTYGPIVEIEFIIDKAGQCKGYALCTFMFPEHALSAWMELDGKDFMGRQMHILAGEEKVKKATADPAQFGSNLSAFQRDRLKSQKDNAGKTQHTWNALFLGTNAVAETLAEKFDVEKRHLLLDEGENSAAVRIAMAETRLVRETRKFLLEHGVKLDAFSQSQNDVRRSKNIIIVKNLSGKAGEYERLQKLLARFGEVKNVIMPPEHGISALVEMANELDAKKAFETLAYSKKFLGGKPLYLEWAPMDVFDENHPARQPAKSEEKPSKSDVSDVDEEKDTKEKPTAEKLAGDEEKKQRTKLLVRNVPFQANLKEVTQLFSAFGELKFVRMPKKPGGEGHRGFCFIDFMSVGDARRAMDALAHSTHLYGRRLVLEWAKIEESMDELRSKTKRKAHANKYSKKSKTKMRSFVVE